MNILDGLPKDGAEAKRASKLALKFVARATKGAKLNPRDQSIVDQLQEGLSLGDIIGVTKDERDAMLLQSGQMMRAGDFKGAQDVLIGLAQLEPTDERVVYTLGVAYQMQGKPLVAGRLFAQAIALDATKHDAYARLGECFMANREYESARGCFEAARIDLGGGPPRADTHDHAGRMLSVLDAQAAG